MMHLSSPECTLRLDRWTTCRFRIQTVSRMCFGVPPSTVEIVVHETSESMMGPLVVHRTYCVVERPGEKISKESTISHQVRYLERRGVDRVVSAQDMVTPSQAPSDQLARLAAGQTGYVTTAVAAVRKCGYSARSGPDWISQVQLPAMNRHQMP